jgi:hypothetical protein
MEQMRIAWIKMLLMMMEVEVVVREVKRVVDRWV